MKFYNLAFIFLAIIWTVWCEKVCEDGSFKAECNDGMRIKISSAFFGRTSENGCAFMEGMSTNCVAQDVEKVVRSLCEGKTRCKVPASKSLFTDPCPGTIKILEIKYQCTKEPVQIIFPEMKLPDGPSCPSVTVRGITWPPTLPGNVVFRPCPDNPDGMASWQCGRNPPIWIYRPDLDSCHQRKLRESSNKLRDVKESAEELSTLVKEVQEFMEMDNMYGSEIEDLIKFIKGSYDKLDVLHEQVENSYNYEDIIELSDALLSERHQNNAWKDIRRIKRAQQMDDFMKTTEFGAFQRLRKFKVSYDFATKNIMLSAKSVSLEDKEINDEVFPHPEVVTNKTLQFSEINGDSFQIKGDTLKELANKGKIDIVFIFYKNFENILYRNEEKKIIYEASNKTSFQNFNSFITYDQSSPLFRDVDINDSNSSDISNNILNSFIISATVKRDGEELKDGNSLQLTQPVVFQLHHIKEVTENHRISCVFWDVKASNSLSFWNTAGCSLLSSNSTHSTCQCFHLTSFALLLSVHKDSVQMLQSPKHLTPLRLITIMGISIGLIGLAASFCSYFLVKSLNSERDTIHRNLFFCLFISQLLFLVTCCVKLYKPVCFFWGIGLHYFFLCSFLWMAVEGVQLYFMLIKVFKTEKSKKLYYYLSAYGIPFVIVGITLLVDTDGYETDQYCWLKVEGGFIWAFAGPVLVILTSNLIMLIIALLAMYQHSKSPAANWKLKHSTQMDKIKVWTKGSLMLVVLLGLTWTLGFFIFGRSSLVFAYLFTFLNTLQGAFIFIFYCLLNEKIMKAYKCLLNKLCGPIVNFKSSHTFSSEKSKEALNKITNPIKSIPKVYLSTKTPPNTIFDSDSGISSMNNNNNNNKSINNNNNNNNNNNDNNSDSNNNNNNMKVNNKNSNDNNKDSQVKSEKAPSEPIYSEITLDDPDLYLDPISIKYSPHLQGDNDDDELIDPGFYGDQLIEGSVVDSSYLEQGFKEAKHIDVHKYRLNPSC